MAWSKEPRLCDHLLSLRGGDQSSGYLLTKYVEIASWARTNHLAQSKLLCEFLTNRIFTSKSLETNASGCRLQANQGLSPSGATTSFLRRPQAFATWSACFLSLFLKRKMTPQLTMPYKPEHPREQRQEWQGELLPERTLLDLTSAISIHLTCGQCVACFVVIVEFVVVELSFLRLI